jgi:hypothetical protein
VARRHCKAEHPPYRSYAQLIRLHLEPELGRLRLEQLTDARSAFRQHEVAGGAIRADGAIPPCHFAEGAQPSIEMGSGAAERRHLNRHAGRICAKAERWEPVQAGELPTLLRALKKHRDGTLFRLALMTGNFRIGFWRAVIGSRTAWSLRQTVALRSMVSM